MRGTRTEKEVEICAKNLANKTKARALMQRNGEQICKDILSAASALCGVKPEHSRLKPYGNP
jgi:hypothetical protein